jgi:hypothetical protein
MDDEDVEFHGRTVPKDEKGYPIMSGMGLVDPGEVGADYAEGSDEDGISQV